MEQTASQHSGGRIRYTGVFAEQALEDEYLGYELARIIGFLRPAILVFGGLHLLFVIPDFFLLRSTGVVNAVLLNRSLFFILTGVLYLILNRIRSPRSCYALISAYELAATVLFLHVFSLYRVPNFLIQAYGLMVLILIVFLVPNRLVNQVMVSVISLAAFLVLSPRLVQPLVTAEYGAALAYTSLVIVLASITAYRTARDQRIQYFHRQELMRLSTVDPLTGIFNRLRFDEEIHKGLSYARRYQTPLSLVLFDLDDFKVINDRYGHLAGDQALRELAELVKSSIRDTDIFARWGGEEFMLLMPNTGRKDALHFTQRLSHLIANNLFSFGGQLTCSFGLTDRRESDTEDSLIQRVDELMYQGKAAGKNHVACA